MSTNPANDNRTPVFPFRHPVGGPRRRTSAEEDRCSTPFPIPPSSGTAKEELTPGQIQTLVELAAKAVEIRVLLELPPDAPIPRGPLPGILLQSRTRQPMPSRNWIHYGSPGITSTVLEPVCY